MSSRTQVTPAALSARIPRSASTAEEAAKWTWKPSRPTYVEGRDLLPLAAPDCRSAAAAIAAKATIITPERLVRSIADRCRRIDHAPRLHFCPAGRESFFQPSRRAVLAVTSRSRWVLTPRSGLGEAPRTDAAAGLALHVRDDVGPAWLSEPAACDSDPPTPRAERHETRKAPSIPGRTGELPPVTPRPQLV